MSINVRSVIYCRVSSQAQVKKGDGLGSQETRCREYARLRGYSVDAVFYDEGISGKVLGREKMGELLAFLKEQGTQQPIIVIIDDISRLARDIETHINLRTAISQAGGKLESPSIEFGDDSDSRLVEHLLASVAAHQREKNAEQVTNRMRARMQNGYWVFKPPVGYRYSSKKGQGKILVPDEPLASAVKDALEGFASGRMETQTEVIDFLMARPEFPKDPNGGIHITRIREMLERVIYTGYIEFPSWGISLQRAKHEPLISYRTFQDIQDRLRTKPKAPIRKDLHLDFPLRGFVLCDSCDKPMTACWSSGRNGKYPYYLCRNNDCPENKKSIKKDLIEGDFEALLDEITPTPDLLHLTQKVVREEWEKHNSDFENNHKATRNQIRALEGKIEKYLDRVADADGETLIRVYEGKITKLENEKGILASQLEIGSQSPVDFDTSFQIVFDFMGNPQKLWHSEDIEDKRLLLKLAFTRPVAYRRNEGFQTAEFSLPFELSRQLSKGNLVMVELSGKRSSQLLTVFKNWLKILD